MQINVACVWLFVSFVSVWPCDGRILVSSIVLTVVYRISLLLLQTDLD